MPFTDTAAHLNPWLVFRDHPRNSLRLPSGLILFGIALHGRHLLGLSSVRFSPVLRLDPASGHPMTTCSSRYCLGCSVQFATGPDYEGETAWKGLAEGNVALVERHWLKSRKAARWLSVELPASDEGAVSEFETRHLPEYLAWKFELASHQGRAREDPAEPYRRLQGARRRRAKLYTEPRHDVGTEYPGPSIDPGCASIASTGVAQRRNTGRAASRPADERHHMGSPLLGPRRHLAVTLVGPSDHSSRLDRHTRNRRPCSRPTGAGTRLALPADRRSRKHASTLAGHNRLGPQRRHKSGSSYLRMGGSSLRRYMHGPRKNGSRLGNF